MSHLRESSEWNNMESALDFDLLAEYLLEDMGAGGFDFRYARRRSRGNVIDVRLYADDANSASTNSVRPWSCHAMVPSIRNHALCPMRGCQVPFMRRKTMAWAGGGGGVVRVGRQTSRSSTEKTSASFNPYKTPNSASSSPVRSSMTIP